MLVGLPLKNHPWGFIPTGTNVPSGGTNVPSIRGGGDVIVVLIVVVDYLPNNMRNLGILY